MRYYKLINDGYLIAVGTGMGGTEISADAYSFLLSVIQSRPTDAPDGCNYRLKADLTWELYELPVLPVDDGDATLDDAFDALAELGVE